MSFMGLFEERLDAMEGKKERVSVAIEVKIEDVGAHGRLAERSQGERNYGPFAIRKPVNLNERDVHRLAMHTLLDNNFTLLSGERISDMGCKIVKLTKKQFRDLKMGGAKLESYFLSRQRPIKNRGDNACVVDYVWDQVKGKKGFKKLK